MFSPILTRKTSLAPTRQQMFSFGMECQLRITVDTLWHAEFTAACWLKCPSPPPSTTGSVPKFLVHPPLTSTQPIAELKKACRSLRSGICSKGFVTFNQKDVLESESVKGNLNHYLQIPDAQLRMVLESQNTYRESARFSLFPASRAAATGSLHKALLSLPLLNCCHSS